MVLVQPDLPKDLNKQVEIYMASESISDKRLAVVEILRRFFNGNGGRK